MKKLISIFLITILNLTFVIGHLSFAAEYTLAPGDKLEVRIINRKELDTSRIIAPDGTISLPLLGRVIASGQTLSAFNKQLMSDFGKYVERPQVVVYLTPRPIYVIQHDLKKNTWDVKEAKSVEEAYAYMGVSTSDIGHRTSDLPVRQAGIKHGDIISVDVNEKPDFWEQNWYKVITATAVIAGVYTTLNR